MTPDAQNPEESSREKTQEAYVLEAHAGTIATLTLNRPEARNSLSLAMLDALHDAIKRLSEDTRIKVVILSANGPVFCAGHDLKELTAARSQPDRGRAFFDKTMTKCSQVMQAIIACPKPVIASVQGTATAAGCQLVATCDLAVAAEEASFATPGVHIGLFCSTPMVALSRNVPRKKAMQMLLTGEMVSAQQAVEWGLLNQAVPLSELKPATIKMAELIASKPASTVKIGKEAFYKQAEMGLADAYNYAASVMTQNMLERDAEEGIGAFIEKRRPNWQS
jgi:enoyl-CoA hydratase/carnithine racemase